jgi:ferritin-like metal-binding protein YciE
MVSSFTACPRVLLFVRLYEAAVPAVSEAQRFTASRPGKRPKKLREEAAMAGIQEQLTSYLTDAHSIEEQALAQLRQAPSIAQVEGLSAAFRDHLAETEGHERAVARLLEQRDDSPSWFKDAVMKLGGKGFIFFAKANPDTPGKLLAHALSYEALEEASYRLLALVAEHGEDDEVVATAKRIGDEEVAMQRRLESHFDEAVAASLAAVEPDATARWTVINFDALSVGHGQCLIGTMGALQSKSFLGDWKHRSNCERSAVTRPGLTSGPARPTATGTRCRC